MTPPPGCEGVFYSGIPLHGPQQHKALSTMAAPCRFDGRSSARRCLLLWRSTALTVAAAPSAVLSAIAAAPRCFTNVNLYCEYILQRRNSCLKANFVKPAFDV